MNLLVLREISVSQPQFNVAQIDMMVRTIHSLKDEAETISIEQNSGTVPELIIVSRPRSQPKDENTSPSADIIHIMDRITDLAADSEQADVAEPAIEDETSIPDLGAILTRIHILANEANAVSIQPEMDIIDETSEKTVAESISDETSSDEDTDLETHKLAANTLDDQDVGAAMQDIEFAVRQAGPAVEHVSEHSASPELLPDTISNLIRDEVRAILKSELPEAVRSLVRETLHAEGIKAPARQKIRTRRFRDN